MVCRTACTYVCPYCQPANGVLYCTYVTGDHSKITLMTRNVFIEITATDYNKVSLSSSSISVSSCVAGSAQY